MRAAIAPFATPYVEIDIEVIAIATGPLLGRQFVILHVHQFDQLPVLCAKEGRNKKGDLILRIGALYVRSREMEATVEVSTEAQMREVLDLAIDAGIRAFLARSRAAGLVPADPRQNLALATLAGHLEHLPSAFAPSGAEFHPAVISNSKTVPAQGADFAHIGSIVAVGGHVSNAAAMLRGDSHGQRR